MARTIVCIRTVLICLLLCFIDIASSELNIENRLRPEIVTHVKDKWDDLLTGLVLPFRLQNSGSSSSSKEQEKKVNEGDATKPPDCLSFGKCKLPLRHAMDVFGICYYFRTGLVGHCLWPNRTPYCDRDRLLACHPFPHYVEAFFQPIPSKSREKSLIILPGGRQLELSSSPEVLLPTFRRVLNDYSARLLQRRQLHQQESNLASKIGLLAEIAMVFVGNELQEVKDLVNEHDGVGFVVPRGEEEELNRIIFEWTEQVVEDPRPSSEEEDQISTLCDRDQYGSKIFQICQIEKMLLSLSRSSIDKVRLRSALLRTMHKLPREPLLTRIPHLTTGNVASFKVSESAKEYLRALEEALTAAAGTEEQQSLRKSKTSMEGILRTKADVLRPVLYWPIWLKGKMSDFVLHKPSDNQQQQQDKELEAFENIDESIAPALTEQKTVQIEGLLSESIRNQSDGFDVTPHVDNTVLSPPNKHSNVEVAATAANIDAAGVDDHKAVDANTNDHDVDPEILPNTKLQANMQTPDVQKEDIKPPPVQQTVDQTTKIRSTQVENNVSDMPDTDPNVATITLKPREAICKLSGDNNLCMHVNSEGQTEECPEGEENVPPCITPRSLMFGSSSWPWFDLDSFSNVDCRCLNSAQVFSVTGHRVSQPCSQPIPWCYVDIDSKCWDASPAFVPSELKYSQVACAGESVARPYWRYF